VVRRTQPKAVLSGAVGALSWWTVLVVYVTLLGLSPVVIHPWLMDWGTTPAEQSMALLGDDRPTSPGPYFTRAITINAPPEQVWPWLLQIGQDRGGFYSNDWLANLIGVNIHNANAMHLEWQPRQLGDGFS
jgi:hypothetical protein